MSKINAAVSHHEAELAELRADRELAVEYLRAATPTVVGLSCVRNEADIIEWMVRYNLKFVDELHLINNLSTDSTLEVLQQLQGEGLPLHVHSSDDPAHPQEKVMGALAARLASEGRGEFFVPLDADELIDAESREAFLNELRRIDRNTAGSMTWKTFLPHPSPGADGAFFRQMTRFRSHEPTINAKLILRAESCAVYRWSGGCHNAFHQETQQPLPRMDMGFRLAHYPVRDAEQLARKVVLGAQALSLKTDRFSDEGNHWQKLNVLLQSVGYDVSVLDVEQVAWLYSMPDKPDESWRSFVPGCPQGLDSKPFVMEGGIRDFPDLARRYAAKPLSLMETLGQCAESAVRLLQAQASSQSRGGFSEDWFSHNIENWTYWMTGLKDVPNARFLEIGSFEGRSTTWLLQNALVRPDARIYCVDTFQGGMEHSARQTQDLLQRFRANVAPWKTKVVECIGDSAVVVPRIQERFHAVYIDGSHVALDCLRDAVNAWGLLHVNGVMVFDDYGWRQYEDPALLPCTAIDAFLACIHGRYRLLHKGYQVAIQKL